MGFPVSTSSAKSDNSGNRSSRFSFAVRIGSLASNTGRASFQKSNLPVFFLIVPAACFTVSSKLRVHGSLPRAPASRAENVPLSAREPFFQ